MVATAASRAVVRCVDRALAGRLHGRTTEECADAAGASIAAVRTRVAAVAERKCRVRPDFGPSSADAQADAFARMLDLHAVLGADLDAAVAAARAEPDGGACQAATTRALAHIGRVRLRTFGACMAAGLRKGAITSAADLDACHASDPHGRVAGAVRAAGRRVRRRCARARLG